MRQHLADLLKRMGNQGVEICHGQQEFGKDIVFYSLDGVGNRMLNACVVKNSKISGAASDNEGARTVLIQVEQVLDTAYIGNGGQDEVVSRVFVVSPYDCSQITKRSIQGKLKQRSGQFEFLCGSLLFEKFLKFYPEFLAFESNLLSSYVAALQSEFEREDPIRFLSSQHSFFAGADKTLKSVYVKQAFKIELAEVEFLVEFPRVEILDSAVSRDDIRDLAEELRFAAMFVANPQVWDNADSVEAARLATTLDRFASELRAAWQQKWEIHRAQSSQTGVAAVPESNAKLHLEVWPSVRDSLDLRQLRGVLDEFRSRVDSANAFTRSIQPQRFSVTLIHSDTYANFSRVREVIRTQPAAFRYVGDKRTHRFQSDLLDKTPKNLFISAPAGYGKTSFCKWNTLNDVTLLVENKTTPLPIYIALHRLSTTQLNNCEDAFFQSPGSAELLERARQKRQRIRLYLDGLDEITTLEQQRRLMELAAEAANKYPQVQVIATGRDYITGSWLRWLGRVQLAELDDSQIGRLVANWLDSDTKLLQAFEKQLDQAPSLKLLMRVPLLGTLIIAVFKRMKSLPENKLKLYETFIDLMCGGWDLAKNVRRDTRFGTQTKVSILTRLAGQLHINGRRDAKREDVKLAVSQIAPANAAIWEKMLDEILEDGLLVRAGAHSYVFSHLSFQEYLAATELADPQGSRSQQALREYLRGEDRWREVLGFYVSIIKRPDETEAWIKKTAQAVAGKGSDVTQRYTFLMESLQSAWPGWSPKKDLPSQ